MSINLLSQRRSLAPLRSLRLLQVLVAQTIHYLSAEFQSVFDRYTLIIYSGSSNAKTYLKYFRRLTEEEIGWLKGTFPFRLSQIRKYKHLTVIGCRSVYFKGQFQVFFKPGNHIYVFEMYSLATSCKKTQAMRFNNIISSTGKQKHFHQPKVVDGRLIITDSRWRSAESFSLPHQFYHRPRKVTYSLWNNISAGKSPGLRFNEN